MYHLQKNSYGLSKNSHIFSSYTYVLFILPNASYINLLYYSSRRIGNLLSP